MRRSSRPRLVFWKFGIFICKMAHFLTVIALDLTQIAYRSAQTIPVSIIVFFLIRHNRLSCIDSGGRGRAFLLLLSLVISTAFFLFFLPSLSGKLRVNGAGSCQFWGPDLRFFYPKVFYQLSLGLGRRGVYRSIVLVAWWLTSRLAEACILALVLARIAFLIKAFQPSRSRPFLSIHNLMDGLRLS